MSLAALALVLAAALLHASWNLIVKASSDRLAAAWMQVTFGALVFSPFLVLGGFPWDRWPSVAASSAIHLGYGLALVGAYDRVDLSLVYPVARGTAPVLVTAGAAVLLDDLPGVWGLIGVAVVAAGILAVIRRPGRGAGWAMLTGALIASYTLVDGAAVRAGEESVRYTIAVFLGNGLAYLPVVLWRRRGRIRRAVVSEGWRNLAGGAFSAAAYLLVLTAARWAPLGLVAAARETSVVFGALGGWLLLEEPMGRSRVLASAAMAGGLVLLVAG